jgi:release factor glutamine methyltransferase
MTTVASALAAARTKLPANEARLLLGHVTARPAAWLMAHDDEVLDEDAMLHFASLVARRKGGEPVAYLLGYREFYGREFAVSPAVLIPRPETELLVDRALAHKVMRSGIHADGAGAAATGAALSTTIRTTIRTTTRAPRILDLGTGSGCIAITLALEIPSAQVCAVDASEAALLVAGKNAERLGASVRLLQSDWFGSLSGESFDLILANPPYIAERDPHLGVEDLRYEPRPALASGADGLDAIRRIVADAPAHLLAGGQLWLEHGYDQAVAVRELLAEAGLHDIEQHRDVAGIVRVSGGRLQQ